MNEASLLEIAARVVGMTRKSNDTDLLIRMYCLFIPALRLLKSTLGPTRLDL